MLVGRQLLQQLEQTEDAHKVMIEALASEKVGAALRGMSDDQAGRYMKRYQEEVVALRNLCSSREQRECAGKSVSTRNQCDLAGRPSKTQKEKLSSMEVSIKDNCKLGVIEKTLKWSSRAMYNKVDSCQNRPRKRRSSTGRVQQQEINLTGYTRLV